MIPTTTAKRGPGSSSTKSPCPWRRTESQDPSFPTSLEHQLLSVPCSLCLDPTRASKDSVGSQQWTAPPAQAWSALGHVHLPSCHLDQPRVSPFISLPHSEGTKRPWPPAHIPARSNPAVCDHGDSWEAAVMSIWREKKSHLGFFIQLFAYRWLGEEWFCLKDVGLA